MPHKDTIIMGDCLKSLSDHRLFPDESVNLVMTSPPYADRRDWSYGGVSPDKYVDWFLPISAQIYRTLKPSGSFVLNIKENVKKGERQTYVLELILGMKQQGWLWVEEYCWFKKNSYPGKWPNRFRDSWERCLHFTKKKKFSMYQEAVKVPIGDWAKSRFKSMSEKDFNRHVSGTNSRFGRQVTNWLNKRKVYPHNVLVFETNHFVDPGNVVLLATECNNRDHPAAFPLELPTWFIRLFSKKGDTIVDPFMGVGTTIVAAALLDRRFVGIELVPEYAAIAKENLRELRIPKRK